MTNSGVVILGIPIPSTSGGFLTVVAVHVVAGLLCVIAGVVAMLNPKIAGSHPNAGSVYYWSLGIVFASMGYLAVIRWPTDNALFSVGLMSLVTATVGRIARRRQRLRLHVVGMGLSYLLLLTAFYVDVGPHLPFWWRLPPVLLWIMPSLIGLPLMVRVLLRQSLLARARPKTG